MLGGLNLGIGGGVRIAGSPPAAPPATIAQTAYGQQAAPTTTGSGRVQTWHIATAVPVIAVAWLAFLRWSLPG